MIRLLNLKVLGGALAVAALCGGLGYWRGHEAGSAAVQAEWNTAKTAASTAVSEAKDNDIVTAHRASTAYQEQKTHEQTKLRVIRQVVTRTVAGQCFDADSLRHLNEAIRPLPPASAAR